MASIVAFHEGQEIKPPANGPAATLVVDQHHIANADHFKIMQPEVRVAYIRHPVETQRLLPLASYHADLVIEKTNEAILMLTALGASTIQLNYSSSVSSEAKAEIELLFGLVNFGGTKKDDRNTNIIYSAKGTGSAPRPLPAMLWLDQPGWRGIIDGRLNGGMKEFALTFTYEHRGGVDTELVSRASKFGLRAGGDFRKAHRVAFSLRGEFPELPTDEAR